MSPWVKRRQRKGVADSRYMKLAFQKVLRENLRTYEALRGIRS